MQLLTQHPSPATIRQALFEDSSKPADSHLLALVLGNGSRHQYRAGKKIRKLRTATELAEALIEAAGGRLAHLVAVCCGASHLGRPAASGSICRRVRDR